MAPIESMIPEDIAPETTMPSRRSLSDSVGDLAASITSAARSTSKALGWRKRIGLGGVARRTLGISLLLLTVFLWTFSNFLASSIFSDHTYDKPFFLVYINSSIFAISLIPMTIHFITKHGISGLRDGAIEAWLEQKHGSRSRTILEDDDEAIGERLLMETDNGPEPLELALKGPDRLTFRETVILSLEFCMLWFFANYFASACLEYTSVASVTILTSTSSVWTLIFCAWMGVEGFSVRKLIGVLASLVGIVLISTVDLSGASDANRGTFPHKTPAQIAIGDLMAFVSAIVYGMYVTVMKRRVGNEDRVNMPLFFGLVGLFNLAFLWPGFFILHLTGVEPFEMPPSGKIWAIIMGNSIASFVSDISWAYAMLLTTPLVVTVGLSLSIPLSLIGEMIQYHQYSSIVYWIGAVVVLLSFVFINHESQDEGNSSPPSMDAAA